MIQTTTAAADTVILPTLDQVLAARNQRDGASRFIFATFPKCFEFAFVLLAGVLFFIVLDSPNLGAQSGAVQVQAGVKTTRWPVKIIVDGAPPAKSTLGISQSTIALKQKNGTSEEIPIREVTDITYDNSSHRKSRGWLHAAGEIGKTPLALGVYPVAAPLAVAAFVAPFKTRTHLIYICWNDAESGSSEVVLEIGKAHYSIVLAELQKLSGKPWLNLPEERKKHGYASPAVDTTN